MKKKKGIIIQAPILSLSAKIELVARFLRNSLFPGKDLKKRSTSKKLSSCKTKKVAKQRLVTEELPSKKKKSA